MSFQQSFLQTAELNAASFEQLIDPAWVEQVLVLTGAVSLRRCRLSAERIDHSTALERTQGTMWALT